MSLQSWRRLLFPILFPFSVVYGLVVGIRNLLFDLNILKSTEFNFPVISVGNITVGGTGKTPHVEYLVKLLNDNFRIGMISRGYKRKTKGYIEANKNSGPDDLGDEPFQIFSKFPGIKVAVDSDRVRGINKLKGSSKELQVIILDDAFQHRYVKPGVSVLLIDYHRPLYKDCMLPAGNLRESADNTSRANIIIVTKVPEDIKPIEKRIWIKRLSLYPYQFLYFTSFTYGDLIPIFSNNKKLKSLEELRNSELGILLVTGIANPQPLRAELGKYNKSITTLFYPDHHNFCNEDLPGIKIKLDLLKNRNKIIIVTEKDAVKLRKLDYKDKSIKDNIYYIPVQVSFSGGHEEFNRNIIEYVKHNKKISKLRQ